MNITTTITGKSGREHRLEVEYEGGMVDNGIGYYEYCGCRGRDVRIEAEVDDFAVFVLRGDRRREVEPSRDMALDLVERCAEEIEDNYRNGGE